MTISRKPTSTQDMDSQANIQEIQARASSELFKECRDVLDLSTRAKRVKLKCVHAQKAVDRNEGTDELAKHCL